MRTKGYVVSVETKEKISNTAKLNWEKLTPEEKKRRGQIISESSKGHKKSKETIEKMKIYHQNRPQIQNQRIAESLRGRTISPEHIENQRKSKLISGTWKPIGHTYIAKGYRWIKVSHGAGINNYRAEHRLILENILGRKLDTNEHVHHVDGNRLNNAPENLALVSKKEHTLILNLLRIVDKNLAKVIIETLTKQFPNLD